MKFIKQSELERQKEVDAQAENRRLLLQRLQSQLEQSSTTSVSNNDIRRLMDSLKPAVEYLRQMEKYPKGFTRINPNDVLRRDHCSDLALDRYAVQGERHLMSPELIKATASHLRICTACQARLESYQSDLVAGQRVTMRDPNDPVSVRHVDLTGLGRSVDSVHVGLALKGYARED